MSGALWFAMSAAYAFALGGLASVTGNRREKALGWLILGVGCGLAWGAACAFFRHPPWVTP